MELFLKIQKKLVAIRFKLGKLSTKFRYILLGFFFGLVIIIDYSFILRKDFTKEKIEHLQQITLSQKIQETNREIKTLDKKLLAWRSSHASDRKIINKPDSIFLSNLLSNLVNQSEMVLFYMQPLEVKDGGWFKIYSWNIRVCCSYQQFLYLLANLPAKPPYYYSIGNFKLSRGEKECGLVGQIDVQAHVFG